MVTGFSSPITETHGGLDTQTSFYKEKAILGCHFDVALMHKYHFLKSRRNTTFSAKVGEKGVSEQVPIRSVSHSVSDSHKNHSVP